MIFDEGRLEYSALLERTNGVRRQYHSFPRPQASAEDEGPSAGAKAKHQLLLFAENVRSCGGRLLAAFRATTSPQDEASSTLMEYENLAYLGRVCVLRFTLRCKTHPCANFAVTEHPRAGQSIKVYPVL